MSANSDRLRQEFDRRLGRRSAVAKRANRPKTRVSQERELASNIRKDAPRVIRQRISTGAQSLPTDLKKAYQRQFGKDATGGVKSAAASFQKTMNNIVEEATREINKRIDTETAIAQAMRNPAPQPEDDPSWFQGLVSNLVKSSPAAPLLTGDLERGTPVGNVIADAQDAKNNVQEGETDYWKGLMEDFSRSPVGRTLDVISRPAYGVAEGLDRALEAGYEEGASSNPLNFLDELGEGFAAGVSGQEKTGFGEVWQRMRENSDIVGMEELRNLDESHPGVTSWLDRAVGLAGELTMDPTNWVSGGSVGILRNTGEQLTESTARAAIRETVDTAARDFFDDVVSSTGGLRYKPSQDALAVYAAQAAEDAIEKNLLEVSAGAHAGWGKMGTELTARSTANRVTESVREQLFKSYNSRIDKVVTALRQGGNLPINSWRAHISQSPEFEDTLDLMMKEATDRAAKQGRQVAWRTRDEFIARLTKADIPTIQRAAKEVRSTLDAPLFQYITDEVYKNTRQFYYNTVGIRVGNKTVPIKTFGKAYSWTKENLPQRVKAGADNFAGAMSYERNFPGRISLMTQANRSVGAQAYERFHKEWMELARNFTKQEDELLFRALAGDPSIQALPPKIEAMRVRMRNELNKMHAEELAAGARPERGAGSVLANDYVFVFNKSGRPEKRTEFKSGRKKAINQTGNAQGWTVERAKNMELKPVESAFESLLARKLKSTRDLTRAYFMKDLIDNYGIMAKPLTDAAVRLRELKEVTYNKLPQQFRNEYNKGNRFYLPREHYQLFEKYDSLSKWNSRDSGAFIREWSKLTNVIKYLSTVPRAGFHIRNMIGDMFMGLLDDVPVRTYREVADKYTKNLAGRPTSFRITKDISKSWDEMKALYDTHANSGFFETEIPLGGSTPTAGQHLSNIRKRSANKARQISDLREDYGRFVHFVAAYRQEANALIKKGYKGERLQDKALEAAVWRVNQHKFDYGALTSTERKIKLAFPFYTFTRKATPTLLQSLFLNPKYLSLPNRFMEYNDGSAADNFNSYFLPDYVKDTGYAFLNNEEEPLYMTADILPSSVLNSIDFTNSQQFAQSVSQQLNPVAQIMPEMALGKQIFSQRPTGSFPEYIMNKFSVPGQFARQAAGPDTDPAWLQAINESWTGAGIPVRQFTEEQQDYGFRAAEDRFIQDPFTDFNRSQDTYRVYQSNRADGTSFRIVDMATDTVVFETQNPSEAIAYAKRLVGG